MSEIKTAGASNQNRRQVLATATTGITAAGVASVLSSQLKAAPAGDSIRPFRFEASEQQLADLRRRVAATKWPDKEQVPDTTQGVQLVTMQQLAQHWAQAMQSEHLAPRSRRPRSSVRRTRAGTGR